MNAKVTASALVVIAALATMGSAGAGRQGGSVGPLKLCTFVSTNDNASTPTDYVKIEAVGGKGRVGTVTIHGAGLNSTVHFTLSKLGIAITSFVIFNSGPATITVKLSGTPAKTRTVHLMLNAAATETAAGCSPR